MAETRPPVIPAIPPLGTIQDRATRDVLAALIDGWHLRNGQTGRDEDRFVRKGEIGDLAVGAVRFALSSPGGGGIILGDGAGPTVGQIIAGLTGQITESMLFKTLGDRINLIDRPGGLLGSDFRSASGLPVVNVAGCPTHPGWVLDTLMALAAGAYAVTILLALGGTVDRFRSVASGTAEFLDTEVHEQGGVLYVDEENPLDEVHRRLLRMGLDFSNMGQLRYLWNQGIQLDREPESLLDEALDFRPKLVVLDSDGFSSLARADARLMRSS